MIQTSTAPAFATAPQQRRAWARARRSNERTRLFIRLGGACDRTIRTLRAIVARHEILRTRLEARPADANPVQIIHSGGPLYCRFVDLSGLTPELRDAQISRWRHGIAGTRRIDSLTCTFLRTGAADWSLALDAPRWIADRGTAHRLYRELQSERNADPPQYADLAEWMNTLLHSGNTEPLTAIDEPCLPAATAIERVRATLPAMAVGADVEAIVRGAWCLYVARALDVDRLRVALAYDLRAVEGLAEAMGPLTVHVPVEASVRGDSTFEGFVADLSSAAARATANPQTTLSLAEAHTPPAAVAFTFARVAGPDAWITEEAADGPPLALLAEEGIGTLDLTMTFAASKLDERSARALLCGFCEFLERVDRVSTRPIGAFAIARSGDIATVEPRLSPPERDVWTWFEACAAAHADRPAARCGDDSLTYSELATRAAVLGNALPAAAPEQIIAILLPPSIDLPAAILAVLRRGAAYLPLDPAAPPARLQWLLENSGAAAVIVNSETEFMVHDLFEGPCIRADRVAGLTPPVLRLPAIDPDHAAYVLYTSGSTGAPKGVVVSHGALASYLRWCVTQYAPQPGEITPVVSPVSFDLTVTSLFTPLLTGGTILLERDPTDVAAMHRHLDSGIAIGLLKITPAHLDVLGVDRRQPFRSSVRAIVIGGEALRISTVRHWADLLPGCRIFNEYGPTEATVGCCVESIGEGDAIPDPVPIGAAIDGARLYVLDRFLQPAPGWNGGELYIAGDGLARGYWRSPALTAERFLPDPFTTQPGRRMYRTGDRVRRDADGKLVYLGRADDQVKIRGHRVEPGEIEGALLSHPAVRACAVVPRISPDGGAILAAYVVLREPATQEAVLKRHLEARLPEYMVPSRIVVLDHLPVTRNGKVNRGALPAIEPTASRALSSPAGTAQEVIAVIWRDVLGREISADANFFEIGGHSLLAMRVIARVKAAFGIEITPRELFDRPTIPGLAAAIETSHLRGRGMPPPQKRPSEFAVLVPASPGQHSIWVEEQMQAGSGAYHIPAAVTMQGPLSAPRLTRCVAELLCAHEILRTTFTEVDGELRQRIGEPFLPALPLIDLDGATDRFHRLAAQILRQPFDLERGPLFRVALFRTGPASHILFLAIHHLIADGASAHILLEQLAALYTSMTFEPPLLQYADYACWQQACKLRGLFEGQTDYWTRRLAGAPLGQTIAASAPAGCRAAMARAHIDARDLKPVRALAASCNATLFTILLAAVHVMLRRPLGDGRVLTGINIDNRRGLEFQRTIGYFVSQRPLYTEAPGSLSFREFSLQVRSALLDAYFHQDVPAEYLGAALGRTAPLFQIKVDYQKLADAMPHAAGLTIEPLDVEGGVCHFDLTIRLLETADGLECAFQYRAGQIEPSLIARLAKAYLAIVGEAASRPDSSLDELARTGDSLRAHNLKSLREEMRVPRPAGVGGAAI
jgi:amino acid adenylation domain-containing protein